MVYRRSSCAGRSIPSAPRPPRSSLPAAGTPNVYVLDVPYQSYNVLGYNECPRAIRNAWIDAITAAPADVSCLQSIPKLNLGQ